MTKYVYTTVLLLLAALSSFGQQQAKPLAYFIPKGFTILDSASGNLNKDSCNDLVVILKNKLEETSRDTTRPLLLLAGNCHGTYSLIARNDSVVLCNGCGGSLGDPYTGITIKNGFFSIEHYGGSRWRWTRIITFKYDAARAVFLLHRDAGESFDALHQDKKGTQEVYNKEDFDKLLFTRYSNDKGE